MSINTMFWSSVCWRLTENLLDADGAKFPSRWKFYWNGKEKSLERDADFTPSGCRFKGSGSSYITDKEGRIIQHTEYMAFGEVLFDEHAVSRTQPYLFDGKELDFETGLYYYGARYYDPKTSIFLNVDPLVEKTMSPYAYTYNNPINLIDPTGMESEPPPVDNYIYANKTPIEEVLVTGKAKKNVGNRNSFNLFYRNWSMEQQKNIDAARSRFGQAEAKCAVCKEIKTAENVLFIYIPSIVFSGGVSGFSSNGRITYEVLKNKTFWNILGGKAVLSSGTQAIMNIEKDNGNLKTNINLIKLGADMFLNPIPAATVGNSSELKLNINSNSTSIEVFKFNSSNNFILGTGADLMIIRRNGFYQKNNNSKIGETIFEIQAEIMSQGVSKGVQK